MPGKQLENQQRKLQRETKKYAKPQIGKADLDFSFAILLTFAPCFSASTYLQVERTNFGFPLCAHICSFSTLATPEVVGKSLEGGSDGGAKRTLIRRVIPVLLLSLTGGVALSAINDLAIFHGCSSKAVEKASQNQKVLEALGEPIVRGPWYDASLAVGHRRHSVSCTFPVSGPQGTGIFQLKAVRTGDDSWFSFLRHHDWDILIMEALLHVPSNEEKNRTFRISLTDSIVVPPVERKD